MHICTNCKKEMICSRTGVLVVNATHTWAYAGDEFECSQCKARTIDTNTNGYCPTPVVVEMKRSEDRLLEMNW